MEDGPLASQYGVARLVGRHGETQWVTSISITLAEAVALPALLITVTLTSYKPPVPLLGAVTWSLVEPLAPGLTVRVGLAKVAVQPLGTAAPSAKVEAEQPLLSVLVTDDGIGHRGPRPHPLGAGE